MVNYRCVPKGDIQFQVKILLFLADVVGLGRLSDRIIAFRAWPKNQRVRYWTRDIDKVMVLREREPGHMWYAIRVFLRNGDKANHLVSDTVFLMSWVMARQLRAKSSSMAE